MTPQITTDLPKSTPSGRALNYVSRQQWPTRTDSLVGAQHAVPVLSRHSVPLLPECLNRFSFSALFLKDARRFAAIESAQPARAASVSASTSTPRAISSGDAYSSGRWL